jgi:hypothetical protein
MIIFGVLIFIAGISLIVKADIIFKVLRDNSEQLWLYIGAVIVRLLFGILFINKANESKFPVVIEIIGWIAILAGIVFIVIGRKRFQRLMLWAFSLKESMWKPMGYIGGILAVCLGLFLIYAYV